MTNTKILALLGQSVNYSYSPFIHNTACELLGLPFHYTVFNIPAQEQVKAALDGARALGIAGFSVTIPYKKSVVPLLDELSPEAAAIKAVNTIVNNNGHLKGYNTDIAGFAAPLMEHVASIRGESVAIFGGGGAALAAIDALNRHIRPSRILLVVRDTDRAADDLRQCGYGSHAPLSIVPFGCRELVAECRLIVNATPLGTTGPHSNSCIIAEDEQVLDASQIVYDMVYNPVDTLLLQRATKAGATTISGIDMLIGQAEEAFWLWTAHRLPVAEIRKKLLQEIKHHPSN